ncbi:MAG: hypothetical protein JWP91_1171 [Fibrobacteres bacterium]|nr:hypothetical protein [Fibrobacterota bacterium]
MGMANAKLRVSMGAAALLLAALTADPVQAGTPQGTAAESAIADSAAVGSIIRDWNAWKAAIPEGGESDQGGDSFRIKDEAPAGRDRETRIGRTALWVGGTGAIVAAGVVAYFIFSGEPKSPNRTISVQ